MDPDRFEAIQNGFLDQIDQEPLEADKTATMIKNLEAFSKLQPRVPAPEPATTPPLPETKWDRFKCGVAKVWDNETTRVAIKAGASVGGVIFVGWQTIHKDRVIERQALAQANQRSL